MQILLASCRAPLERWEPRPLWPGVDAGPGARDRRDVFERAVGAEAPGEPAQDGLHRRAARAILAYEIFPRRLAIPVVRRAPVEPGDAVGLRYRILPGVHLFFASRVVDRFDG